MDAKIFFEKLKRKKCSKQVKKNQPKSCIHTYGSWKFVCFFFFAQNSQEFHFRFLNSFIEPSLPESLLMRNPYAEIHCYLAPRIFHA